MALKEQPKRLRPRAAGDLRAQAMEAARTPLGEQLIEGGCRFLLSAVLSAAEIFSGCTPFGLAFVAASGAGLRGFSALVGSIFGTMLHRGFADGLRYAAAAILIFSVSFAFYDIRLFRRAAFMPLVATAVNGVTGFIYLSSVGWTSTSLIYFATEVFFTGAATYFYRIAFDADGPAYGADAPLRQQISLLLLVATALIALSAVTIYQDISLGRTIAALLVMLAAYSGSFATGGCVGLCFGLAMDFAAGGTPFYTMAFGVSGLVCGLLARYGKTAAAASYILTNAVAVLWTWGDGLCVSLLYEVFIASVALLIVPSGLFNIARALFHREATPQPEGRRVQSAAQDQVAGVSRAFATIYESLKSTAARKPQPTADAARVFDRAAESACKDCVLRSNCWQENYVSTYNACNDALPAMLRRGRAEAADFPGHFSSRCVHFPQFVTAVNEELMVLLYHRQYEHKMQQSRQVLVEQYGEVSTMLGSLATSLADPPAAKAGQAEPLMALTGIASRRREGEAHCGDAGTCFKTADGTLYVLLCDGMGSGELAQQESAFAVELLEQFLTSGVATEGALRTLASALGLRAEEGGGFTTIDLLEVNLYTGRAAIYKYGAAPSYLRRNTRVTAVTGSSLPAGTSIATSVNPDVTRFTLGVGDCVLLLSDGVTDGQSDETLRAALQRYRSATQPSDFASRLLASCESGDDQTALLVYIEQRT